MTRALLTIVAAVLALTAEARQSVGLVLSGGGAKGIAHIGVIKALEEHDIAIDYVAGTSMGSIIGSLYAMGYTPDEMLALVTSKSFGYWSTGTIDPSLSFYFSAPAPSPAMFSFDVGRRDTTDAVPASLISPLPMNFEFMRLFSPYTAACGGDFDRLMVPFRCVASDGKAKHKVVLRSGDLGRSVRASMSFPGVFQPTEIDGRLLYDGGIYDNYPLDVMNDEFAPDIIIGVNVGSTDSGPQTSLLDQIEQLIMAPDHADIPAARLVNLRLDLDRFGLLDFQRAEEISRIGYDFAKARIDSICDRVTARIPAVARDVRRSAFKARVPELRFDSVDITGGTRQQNRFMHHLFEQSRYRDSGDTFGVVTARDAYYRAISTGRIRDVRLTAHRPDSARYFRLNARTWLKGNAKASVGGYLTSSTNSYLYLGGHISSLSFHSMEAGAQAWIGQSYMAAAADARIYTPTRLPMALGLEAVAWRRKYYESAAAFFDNRLPVYVIGKEFFGRLKLCMAAGRSGTVYVFGGAGNLLDYFYRDNTIDNYAYGRDRASYVLWQAGATYRRSTLNAENYPVEGFALSARAMAVGGSMRHHSALSGLTAESTSPMWVQAEARVRSYFPATRHFSMGVEGHAMLSTRKLARNYNAAITAAPVFEPTPSSADAFRASFRANSFLGAGLVPVYRYNDALSARLGLYGFLPLRKICEGTDRTTAYYGRWLHDPEFLGEAAVSYKLPFAAITGWCNYTTGYTAGWQAGISFGVYLTAPKFLQL